MRRPNPESGGTTVASNALANVGRGAALSLVALMLPAVLARTLVKPEFDVWMLLAQITGYTTLLDLGMQVSVARFVALARARNDERLERSTVAAGIQVLLVPAGLSAAAYAAIIWFLPSMFPGVEDRLIGQARAGLAVLAAAGLLGLPTSALLGLAAGRQRSQISAVVTALSNVGGAIVVALLAWRGAPIAVLAVGLAVPRILGHLYQWHLAHSLLGGPAFRSRFLDATVRRSLLSFSATLVVWSAAAFVITGLDVSFVGRFQFRAVGAYASVAAVVGVLVGVHTSVTSALLPVVTAAHDRRDPNLVASLVLRSTRISLALIAAPTTVLVIWAPVLLRSWLVNEQLIFDAILILRILVLAAFVRLLSGAYVVALVSIGAHRKLLFTPSLEAIANLTASLALGHFYGARGVAFGTAVGAVVGFASRLIHDMPRTQGDIHLSAGDLMRHGIGPVLLGVAPCVVVWRVVRLVWPAEVQYKSTAVVGALAVLATLWIAALRSDDRTWLVGLIHRGRSLGGRNRAR